MNGGIHLIVLYLDVIVSVLIGIISGIVSAIIFHFILKRTTPKIIISGNIEKRKIKDTEKYCYHIKVVNLRKRYAINVVPYLDFQHTENGPDGTILRLKALPVHAEHIPYIAPYSKKDSNCEYAVRFEITDEVENEWAGDNTKSLCLQIFCADEFSGTGKFFKQVYYGPDCIVQGRFRTGKCLEIIPS